MAIMKINKIEYLEILVWNLPQTVYFYKNAFGFNIIGYGEDAEKKSVLLGQHAVKLLFSTPKNKSCPTYDFLLRHGEGVKDIALSFNDTVNQATCISLYGSVQHTLMPGHAADKLPHITYADNDRDQPQGRLTNIDHLAICVPHGSSDHWRQYYEDSFGFRVTRQEHVMTKTSGMNSQVLESANGEVKFVFVEPAKGDNDQSQVASYLKNNNGPGVQHIAFLTGDIVAAINSYKHNGIEFLNIPDTYYAIQSQNIVDNKIDFRHLKTQQILLDKENNGFLYQAFTKAITSNMTLFLEIIQRDGNFGFGSNNIKTLFQAVEIEQNKHDEFV